VATRGADDFSPSMLLDESDPGDDRLCV